jgi:hypothetical protein
MKDAHEIQVAVSLATATAAKATEVANTAVKVASDLASKTAESNGIINTNMEWIKKSLSGIETKLETMDKAFVTASQHTELCNKVADHEVRINSLETNHTRTTVLLSIGIGILGILVSILVYHIFQQG